MPSVVLCKSYPTINLPYDENASCFLPTGTPQNKVIKTELRKPGRTKKISMMTWR